MRYSGPYDKDLVSLIEHTVLQPDATTDMVREQCQLAMEYGFAGVCVNLVHIALAAHVVQGSKLTVCTGVGFPLGASGYLLKATETRDAIASGADAIDMVINIGAVKQGDYRILEREIQAVKCAADGRTVKVLLEICYLSDAEIEKVCLITAEQGADFVKTSTGFGPGGATVEAVRLMRQTVGPEIGVNVVLGDGEIDEGSVWEAALAAAHYQLNNLTAVVDRNNLQISGFTETHMRLEPLDEKWKAFGWVVTEIDGHDMEQIVPAFEAAARVSSKPQLIIAKTVKGKGLDFLENLPGSHSCTLSNEQYDRVMGQLKGTAQE